MARQPQRRGAPTSNTTTATRRVRGGYPFGRCCSRALSRRLHLWSWFCVTTRARAPVRVGVKRAHPTSPPLVFGDFSCAPPCLPSLALCRGHTRDVCACVCVCVYVCVCADRIPFAWPMTATVEEERAALTEVLWAFSALDDAVGYCQGTRARARCRRRPGPTRQVLLPSGGATPQRGAAGNRAALPDVCWSMCPAACHPRLRLSRGVCGGVRVVCVRAARCGMCSTRCM